jgi:two-component system KDP operon response regulator KdpE
MALTVLIVDDEPDVRRILIDLFRDEGYRVIAAEDGSRALEIAATRHPDIVLSDVAMPRLDGVTLAQRLARWNPPIPVVLMSAAHTSRVGQVPFVAKPFDIDDMLAVVEATAQQAVAA